MNTLEVKCVALLGTKANEDRAFKTAFPDVTDREQHEMSALFRVIATKTALDDAPDMKELKSTLVKQLGFADEKSATKRIGRAVDLGYAILEKRQTDARRRYVVGTPKLLTQAEVYANEIVGSLFSTVQQLQELGASIGKFDNHYDVVAVLKSKGHLKSGP